MKRRILEFFLLPLAKFVLKRYRPVVVAVTGSVGKTSAKEAIFHVLSQKHSVWKTKHNLNTAIGLCVTVIGGENAKGSLSGWLKNIFKAVRLMLFHSREYPQCLVLEMGADRPGDMDPFIKIVRPDYSVVTAIGDIPVHVANYAGITEVVDEKNKILKALGTGGVAVLNADDVRVIGMECRSDIKIFSFGFSEKATVRVLDYAVRDRGDTVLTGISFRLQYQGSSVPVRLSGVLGRPYAYACAAAAAAGIAQGMHLVDIAKGLEGFSPEKGRMRVIRGVKSTLILDDSYNAAPAAMNAALDTLADMKDGEHRVIGVLGDMLELGKYAEEAHRSVGKRAAGICDILCLTGENMKFALDEAKQAGFPGQYLFHEMLSDTVPQRLLPFLEGGDVVLVKGSQGMRMEKVVERLMTEPSKASEVLVRQTREWKTE